MTLKEFLQRLRQDGSAVRHDAAAAFIQEQVQYISPRIVETVFTAPEWAEHLPLEPNLPEAALVVGFDLFAPAGQAESFKGSGKDLPKVGGVIERITRHVDDHGIARELSDSELLAAAFAAEQRRMQIGGTTSEAALDAALERAAAQAVAEYHETLAISGKAAAGILGVTNQTGLPEYTPPNGGLGSPDWEDKTGAEIVADMLGLLNATINSAKRREFWPNHMALPLNKYLTANDPSKKLETTDETPLAFFQRTNLLGTRLEIAPWTRLNGQGTSSSGFALCYRKDADVISYAAPVVHKVNLPPKREVAGWEWAHTGRSAGVLVRRPFAVGFMEGF